ncbi:MAG: adenosylcobinamide-GDP ribazoletransferase [Bryobacterales bacterium]|nr:adenosylcobinamide-GDP ribazoletransferase [Bryobacterales bacterium]
MTKRFLAALQFLTVLPIRGSTATPGQAAIFFAITGALLGTSAGAVFLAANPGMGRSTAALLSIGWLLFLTGCLHEDGLADVADAVRAGRTREKVLAILKDSRIGTYGALALIVSLLLRWQALAQSPVNPVLGLAATLAISRSAMVVLAATTPSVSDGLGRAFAAEISQPVLLIVAAQALAFSLLAGWAHAIAMTLASALTILLARTWFLRRLGGVNGDCLGATCQAVETLNLVILAWRHST